MSYWFFFSYARLDRDDYLKKFFDDLKNEVRLLSGELNPDAVGFFDSEEIEPGEKWPDELSEALQSSRAFISVYSPTYFQKEFCGKEWHVFRSRQRQYFDTNGLEPPLILPVLWVPENKLPSILPQTVSDIQYKHDDFGAEYSKQGLKQLIKLKKYEDDYLNFVSTLAGKLVDAAKIHRLPQLDNLPPLIDVPSAFHSSAGIAEASTTPEGPAFGPRYVQFIYVAEKRDQMSKLRIKLDAYGTEGGKDWKPYCPPNVTDVIGILAQDIATDEKLYYEELKLTDDLVDALKKSEDDRKLVVIVVDTWTLQIKKYEEIMREYDDQSFINCVLLVPWNAQDEETNTNSPLLKAKVDDVFYKRKQGLGAACSFLYPVGSLEDFKLALYTALYKARERILERLEVEKIAKSTNPIPKPIIVGPGGN